MISTVNLNFWIKNNYNVLFKGKHGVGKCLGKGTPILMFDGSTKLVEDIKKNDLLMGPDSKQRRVLSTCTGMEKLYRVSPTKGDPYIVNSSHILSLKMCSDYAGLSNNSIININVEDFIKKSNEFKRRALGWRTGVDFKDQIVPIDPYFIGLWLGDGTSDDVQITTADKVIVNYLSIFADQNNLLLRESTSDDRCKSYSISSGPSFKGCIKNGRNKLRTLMQELRLFNNKHIPLLYKSNSRETRLQLLAGLIDSDGSFNNNCYDFTSKSEILSNDICFLARSLGLAAYTKLCKKGCFYKDSYREGIYYRTTISGNIDEVPVKLERKKARSRLINKDVLKSSIDVSLIGDGDYYGFEIDGDHLFLLGDFTVTHNTATILQAFVSNNLKFQYFSASTMDPWVDFIGVPKEKIDENGNSYLDLIRPKHFQEDQVEAIFLDEFNRASKKVRNAVMELIQFKSINGKKFNNLKIIWAAINPDDDADNKYDVETLDPAQMDRFHVITDIPYLPYAPYFREKYGKDIGDVAVLWWKELNKEQKDLVSPRRLDYALDMYSKGGDLKFVLPNGVNISKLILELSTGSTSKKLDDYFKSQNENDARTFLLIENNYASCINKILNDKKYTEFFLPLISDEKLIGLMSKNKTVENFVFNQFSKYESIINNIANAKSSFLASKAVKVIKANSSKVTIVQSDKFDINKARIKPGYVTYWNDNPKVDFTTNVNKHITNISYAGAKRHAYSFYEKNLPKVLDEHSATIAIRDLSEIICSSHVYGTLGKMKHITGMLNHSINWFIENKKDLPLNEIKLKIISRKMKDFLL